MIEKLNSYNPADGSYLGSVDITPVEKLDLFVQRAKAAQKYWGCLDIDERIRQLKEVGKVLEAQVPTLGLLLSQEMGKGLRSGTGEVASCARSIAYVAELVKQAIKPVVTQDYGMKTRIEYNPRGICGIIAPWNYPVSMAHWMIIPALTAGNAVILKPSEETPLVAQRYVDALSEVLPKHVLQIVHGDGMQGRALVKSNINFIGFTGSLETGKQIMRDAAEGLKPLMMELGGKDPMIVLRDADLEEAAGFAVANSLENAGQMCISTERIFVDANIADAFEKRVVAYTSYYKVGSYDDKEAKIGPIINENQRTRILEQIDDAIAKGARVLVGGKNHPPAFIVPTVLAGITDDMRIANEETFGPVVCINRFSDVSDAVATANRTKYGLGAVVFGKEGVGEIVQRLEAGMVGVNTSAGGGGDTPWVGAKQSSYGYHGSPDGHRQFTQVKVVNEISI